MQYFKLTVTHIFKCYRYTSNNKNKNDIVCWRYQPLDPYIFNHMKHSDEHYLLYGYEILPIITMPKLIYNDSSSIWKAEPNYVAEK